MRNIYTLDIAKNVLGLKINNIRSGHMHRDVLSSKLDIIGMGNHIPSLPPQNVITLFHMEVTHIPNNIPKYSRAHIPYHNLLNLSLGF